MKLLVSALLENSLSRWQVRKWYQSQAKSQAMLIQRSGLAPVHTFSQVKSLGSADWIVEVGDGYTAETRRVVGTGAQIDIQHPNWSLYYNPFETNHRATQTTTYYDMASDEEPGLVEAMSLSFAMRLETMLEQTSRIARVMCQADTTALTDIVPQARDTSHIVRSLHEVKFIELGFAMKLATVEDALEELLQWTAKGELAYLTSGTVAGGRFEYDDLVAHERGSQVRCGRILGSPEAPELYRVEFGHGNLATIAASELCLIERAAWPD